MRYVPVVLLSLCLAMGCGPEGGGTPQDSGTLEDAGTGQDAGTTTPDSGAETPDSGTTTPDSGTETPDAGTENPDSGTTTPDAGTETPDAGTTTPDAGTTTPDAGTIPTSCGIPYLGDPNGAPDFTITALGPDWMTSPSIPLTQGSIVSLVEPPQGGRVSFIGVRDVINMDPCGVTLMGVVENPITGKLMFDSRTVNLERSPDGKGSSTDEDYSTFSNVPLCPNNWSSMDLYDQNYELAVILQDSRGKGLQKTLTIRPACNVPGEERQCLCMCKQGYKLGQPCP
ncbi:hypothetical protein JQX13_24480 [Archangium violaceum]|uniref:hypothetical protein n=1 Tax=Archangium violaceum TaxID=83451 RepID=UPI00193B1C11|nr:hypothetical protein [Archangium violaceum]QRK12910.1 hypothetical protein JQX13_24480 [Archangium violaceum]